MTLQTTTKLSDQRSNFAYSEVVSWGKTWRDKATTLAKGLPISLRSQGLPVVLASLMNKDGVHERQLVILIERWVMEISPYQLFANVPVSKKKLTPGMRILEACISSERSESIAAQAEALAILELVKLFSGALYGSNTAEAKEGA